MGRPTSERSRRWSDGSPERGGCRVIPAKFDYCRVASADEALSQLQELGDDAKLIAGGHSLIPLMKLRLASPGVLIDIAEVRDLDYIEDRGDHVAVGALTRYRDIERSALLREQLPLLAHASGLVGDPQVRNRGTIGGSLVHGDPAADLPSVTLATGATMVIRGPRGVRQVPAREFFLDFLETALDPDELLTEVHFPKAPGASWAYEKYTRRAQDYAMVGVAVVTGSTPGIALINMGSTPVFCTGASQALGAGSGASEVAELASADGEPPVDLNGDVAYRRQLARTLTERALRAAGVTA